MSFYTAVESQPKMNQQVHLPNNVRGLLAERGTIEYKKVLPPMNSFGGQQRLKPQSSFSSTNLFSANSQLDYWLSYNGFLENLRLEMDLQVNPAAANPLNIIGPYLLDRVEIYDSNQNIMQTVYADNIFLQRLHWDINKSTFENSAEGVNNTTFGSIGPIAANTKFTLLLNIPCSISDSQLKGNIIEGRILIRVFFSNHGILPLTGQGDLFAINCDIIQHAEQLSGPNESREVLKKKNCNMHYRVLNPTRVASFAISNAVASQYYDVQLVSGTQMSAFIYFVVRPTPIIASNVQSYVQGISFQLYDEGMTLVGITQDPVNNRYVVGQRFGGSILNSALGGGIYLLPFAVDIKGAMSGNQTGFYQLTQRETIRLYMPTTLVTGNYVVDIYSMDYSELIAKSGRLDFKK